MLRKIIVLSVLSFLMPDSFAAVPEQKPSDQKPAVQKVAGPKKRGKAKGAKMAKGAKGAKGAKKAKGKKAVAAGVITEAKQPTETKAVAAPFAPAPVVVKMAEDPYAGKWVKVSDDQFDIVSAGNADTVVALKNGNAFKLKDGKWDKMKGIQEGALRWIGAGLDGTIAVVQQDGTVRWNRNDDGSMLDEGKWKKMDGAPRLSKVDVGDRNFLVGVAFDEVNGRIAYWECRDTKWVRPKSADGKEAEGFDDVSCNDARIVYANDENGNMFANGQEGVPVKVMVPMKPVGPKGPEKILPPPPPPATGDAMDNIVSILTQAQGKKLDAKNQAAFRDSLTQLYNERPVDNPDEN